MSFPGHLGYWTKNDEDVVVSIGARRPVDDDYNPADFIYRNLKAIESTPEIWKRFGPLESELVKKGSSKVVIFDRTPVILLEWDGQFSRDNTPFYTHTTSAIYQDGSQYVDVEFYVASCDPEAAKRAGNKYQMLRDQILSSIRLVSADK
ncbi:unknown [Sutterella sp. CAG:351]|nr:unknown [Sutterella sp. CAG:351]